MSTGVRPGGLLAGSGSLPRGGHKRAQRMRNLPARCQALPGMDLKWSQPPVIKHGPVPFLKAVLKPTHGMARAGVFSAAGC